MDVKDNKYNPVVINITVNIDPANQLLSELIASLNLLVNQYIEAKDAENKRIGKV